MGCSSPVCCCGCSRRTGRQRRRPGPWRVAHVSTVHRSDDPRILRKECQTLAEAGYCGDIHRTGSAADRPRRRGVRVDRRGRASPCSHRRHALARRAGRLADPPGPGPPARPGAVGGRRAVQGHGHAGRVRRARGSAEPGGLQAVPSRMDPAIGRAGARIGILVAGRMVSGVVAATPPIARRFPADQTVVVQNFPLRREFADLEPMPYAERPMTVAYVGRVTEAVGGLVMADAVRGLRHRPSLRVVIAGPMDAAVRAVAAGRAGGRTGHRGTRLAGPLRGRRSAGGDARRPRGLPARRELHRCAANQTVRVPRERRPGRRIRLPGVAGDRRARSMPGCSSIRQIPAAVSAAIDTLLDDPERAAAMGRRGRAAVLERYMWDDQGARLVALYGRLMPSLPVPERSSHEGPAREGDRFRRVTPSKPSSAPTCACSW